ncbi:MAG: hypothetical protein E7012_05350 [Alphaproteobacteria bacterium]|nr:hypothetical protein [Alphaproteobacteria bacterium]
MKKIKKILQENKFVKVTFVLVMLYVALTVIRNSYGITGPGEGGVLVTLGTVSPETKHGISFKMPFISELTNYNIRQQTTDYTDISLKTGDLQNVFLSFSVIYQINDLSLPEMVQEYDMNNYVQDILSPKVEAAVQDVIGENDVWLLVTKKQTVTDALKYILADKMSEDDYLVIRDVLLKAPKFDAYFENEVLAKLTEEVKLEKAKIQTQIAHEEAQQMLIKASVDPKVAEMMSKALSNPLIIKYEATKALRKWNGQAPSTIMSGAENTLPIIGINK